MIASIMYAAIGFLTATLLALAVLPSVWRRAVRLTRKRIEGAIPVSMAEIQADKDQLRAGFALEARRLELDVEELRTRTAEQWAQIGRQTEELWVRQNRIDDTTARLADIEARHDTLLVRDREIGGELAERTEELAQARATLEQTRTRLDETGLALEETSARAGELQVEHVAMSTLRGTLDSRIADLDNRLKNTTLLLEESRSGLIAASRDLTTAQTAARELTARLSRTDSELTAATDRADVLSTELSALQIHAQELEQRAVAAERQRDETAAQAQKATTDALGLQLAAESAARHAQDTAAMLQAEKAMLEGALSKAREERNDLQSRLDGGTPAPVGVAFESGAVLRERLSEIAADVAHLTAALEGPGSPIAAILAANPAGKKKIGAEPTLADRIRLLQEKAALHHRTDAHGTGAHGLGSLTGQRPQEHAAE